MYTCSGTLGLANYTTIHRQHVQVAFVETAHLSRTSKERGNLLPGSKWKIAQRVLDDIRSTQMLVQCIGSNPAYISRTIMGLPILRTVNKTPKWSVLHDGDIVYLGKPVRKDGSALNIAFRVEKIKGGALRGWDNDWAAVEARLLATPIQDLMLFDLMDIYKLAGANDAPYGHGRLQGQRIAFADQMTRDDDISSTANARVGPATAFFSHPWNMRAREFFEVCVTAFQPEDFVWIDLYMHNQFSGTMGSEFSIGRLPALIESIGKVVAVMTPWHDPIPLKRIWCMFELVCAMHGEDKGVTLELIMSKEQKTSLVAAGLPDVIGLLQYMLVDVKICNAEATVEQDKVLILTEVMKLPEQHLGCEEKLKTLLRGWVIETLEHAVIEVECRASTEEHTELVDLMGQVGRVFEINGMPNRARKLFVNVAIQLDRALAIQMKTLDPDHADNAMTLHNMANIHTIIDDHDEALRLLERALAIRMKALGPDHADTATALYDMALVQTRRGMYCESTYYHNTAYNDEALKLFEQALAIRMQALGPDHVDTVDTMHNMAMVHGRTGNHDEALRLFEQALAIAIKAFGPDHANTAQTLNNIAVVHKSTGNHDEALKLYERALAIQMKALGPDHAATLGTTYNMAGLLEEKGDRARAKALFERCVAGYTVAYGAEHSETEDARQQVASCEARSSRAGNGCGWCGC